MPDLMAIVSKAIFEKAAGKAPQLGARLAMDRYVSANKNLEPLTGGGRLYLVTVRPPDEALWLVAVLEQPHFDGTQWIAAPCDTPITDISELRGRIKFESGKGMSQAPGALGMSLQTPRALAAEDIALLDAKLGGRTIAPAPGALALGVPPASDAVEGGDEDRAARLFAAVLADPANDHARQVYADELVMRNDPRGEYIQVSLALAGPVSIRKREALTVRRDELAKRHAATWWPYELAYRVNRGFIEVVTGTFSAVDAVSARLFAAEPVVELVVSDVDDSSQLAGARWFSRIRRLTVRGGVDDDGFATIVRAKHAQQLVSLNVTASELSSEALGSLGKHLPACRTLVLTACRFGDEGLAALCRWKHLGALENLYLTECEVSSEGVAALVARKLPSLTKLVLSNNELDDEVAAAFAEHAGNLPALRILELKRTGLSGDALETFAGSKLALTRLDVRGTEIRDDDAPELPFVRADR